MVVVVEEREKSEVGRDSERESKRQRERRCKKTKTYPSTSAFRARERHSSTRATAPWTGVEAAARCGSEEDDEEEETAAAADDVEVGVAGRRRRCRRFDGRCC